jgi:hypothetical protein
MLGHRRLTTLIGVGCAAAVAMLPATPAQAAGYHSGSGFLSYDAGLLSSYTIHLVDTPEIEEFRAEAESVAAELTSIMGSVTVTVASGVVQSSYTPGPGEVTVKTDETSSCTTNRLPGGLGWLGCTNGPATAFSGGPRTDVEYVQDAKVTVNIVVAGLASDVQRHVVAHEVGHALGLQHYDAIFEGHYQIMRSTTDTTENASNTYQSGDINGLLYERDRGAP